MGNMERRRAIAVSMIAMASVVLVGILTLMPTHWTSAIVIAYNMGYISGEAASVDLAGLGISAVAIVGILSAVPASALSSIAATALVTESILAWMGPYSLLIMGAIVGIAA